MALDQAITELIHTLDRPARDWRQEALQRIVAVRDALSTDRSPSRGRDGWLAARGQMRERDRSRLLARLTSASQRLLERPVASADPEEPMPELRRLAHDLDHYRQRLHDLAYDSLGMELGGSE